MEPQKHRIIRICWIVAGILALLVAVVAYILPLIPTPPFLALSMYCFMQGSARFHNWLMFQTAFGRYLRIFLEKRTLPKKFKIILIIVVVLGTAFSSVFVLHSWLLRSIVLTTSSVAVVFLLTIKNTGIHDV